MVRQHWSSTPHLLPPECQDLLKREMIMTEPVSGAPGCEVITVGTELLLGQIVDTNTTTISQELGQIGVSVRFRTAVGDLMDEMTRVIRSAVERCDLVIVTGGLGPTLDDLTREAVGEVAGVDLEFRQDLMDQIDEIFRRAGYRMPVNNRRQAYVPTGSEAIPNAVGTAPGFICEVNGTPIICLPGVPRELKYLLARKVIPWIQERFGLSGQRLTYRVLKTVGIGESKVDHLIGDLIRPGANPEVGLLASQGEIKIRIAARAKNAKEANALINPVAEEVQSRLGNKIYGENESTLEGVVDSLLAKNDLTLAIVETFSAGVAAQRLHRLPSVQLVGSMVIPDLGHLPKWFGQTGIAVEKEPALPLARKLREKGSVGIGLAIVGFPRKAGDVYSLKGNVGVSGERIEKTFSWEMGGDLLSLQERGSVIGLNTLRMVLLEWANL